MTAMRITLCGCLALACLTTVPARAASDVIERLATCQDSWMDWKDDAVKTKAFGEMFTAAFVHKPQGAAWAPKAKETVLGLPLTEAYPQSVGMGVGFSVTVEASFDTARAHLEKAVGKSLKHCEASDGMKTCDLEIAPKRTLTLMSGDSPKSTSTLLGCFYLYEK
jgi:hypothetical protein